MQNDDLAPEDVLDALTKFAREADEDVNNFTRRLEASTVPEVVHCARGNLPLYR